MLRLHEVYHVSMAMRERIEETLGVLIGKPFRYAGRAATMAWLGFGDDITVPDREEGTLEVAEYALHLQCTWRIRGPEGIITGATDLFYSPDDPPLSLDNEEWDKKVDGRLFRTLCDARLEALFERHGDNTLIVQSVAADDVGSLQLTLTGGYVVEVFPDDSLPGEHWRFFRPGDLDSHLVVTGLGIEEYEEDEEGGEDE